MHVQMGHCLPGGWAIVDDEPIAVGESKLFCNEFRCIQEMPVVTVLGEECDSWGFFAGYDDDVNGGLGVNISKRHNMLVLIDDVSRNFSVDNLRE